MADPQETTLDGVKHQRRPARRHRLTAKVEPEVYSYLSQRASAEGVTLSKLVRKLVWQFVGKPLPPRKVKRPRRELRRYRMAAWVTTEAYDYLRRRAFAEGVTMSQLVRRLVLDSLGKPLLPDGVKHHD